MVSPKEKIAVATPVLENEDEGGDVVKIIEHGDPVNGIPVDG